MALAFAVIEQGGGRAGGRGGARGDRDGDHRRAAVVAWSTAMQQQVPDEELGRLNAFNSLGEQIAVPAGYLLVAAASAYWSSGHILLVCSVVILAAGVANACVRDVRRIRRR
ncbi:hypothetical protein OG338_07585 [Streptomyces sp. NBC_00726]|uniref:hypothetical protein n=1 Tax=Streptomyces sp. NBC_00726 TaxID=2903674 RepID=UPI00386AD09A